MSACIFCLVVAFLSISHAYTDQDGPEGAAIGPATTFAERHSSLRRALAAAGAVVAAPTGQPYQMGSYSVRDVWVSPTKGDDAKSGATRTQAKRTLTAAWDAVPRSTTLTGRGYRFLLTAGVFTESMLPNYWENRWGSQAAPIIIQAADGAGTTVLEGINMYNCRHVYFIGVKLRLGGDHPLHCELCVNLLLRNVTIAGICPSGYRTCGVQEAAKLNQCTGIWVENSEIYNGWNAAFDCMVCQYGHVINSRIHSAGWCAFVKGGSAYWLMAGKEVYNCLTSGISAGQGTGFEYMVRPWIQWDVYDLKVFNNYVHGVAGAGLGVWGCYNCLFAHNTLVRVGRAAHTIEVNFGPRSCDGSTPKCSAHHSAGGWGPRAVGTRDVNIPNQNVFFFNNLIFNPPGYQSMWKHLQVEPPRSSNTARLPEMVHADTNLVFRGNLFVNGPAAHPLLGTDEDAGCKADNPTCNEGQLRSQNYFNTLLPVLTPDFRPAANSGLDGLPRTVRPLPAFGAWARGNSVPAGTLPNRVPTDKDGASRATATADAPGAWVVPSSRPASPPPRRRPPLLLPAPSPTPVRHPPQP